MRRVSDMGFNPCHSVCGPAKFHGYNHIMSWFGKLPQNNTNADFIGLPALKEQHAAQIVDFENWAAQSNWQRFHDEHYDWWTFPINLPSSANTRYTVYQTEIDALKSDADFMRGLLRGTELVAASWGWDLARADYLTNPLPAQEWQMWPVRLHKAALCMQCFGCEAEFASLQKFGRDLLEQGHVFSYRGHDLTPLFRKRT